MMRVTRLLGLLSLGAATLQAQGSLSQQGFGYPAGSASARVMGAGGAFQEFDPRSVRNPASIGLWGQPALYMQYEPEFRRVVEGGNAESTRLTRFPLLSASVPAGNSMAIAGSSTTFLDRSWETIRRGSQRIGPDSVDFVERFHTNGAINDLRLAVSRQLGERFFIGVAGHAFVGGNRVRLTRTFSDSTTFGGLDDTLKLGYVGSAFSAGAIWTPLPALAFAASARLGQSLRLTSNDTTLGRGDIPNSYSAAIRFDGIPGASFAARAERTLWSSLSTLGSASAVAVDTWDYSIGLEATATPGRAAPILYRAGYRDRGLPFVANGKAIKERSITAGTSLPLSGSRAGLDFAVWRAVRSGAVSTDESAWVISIGLTVRP
ncbi:MAG TPA: hypothetical protein VGQ52_13270 [Gemmatimonadaceae bacterium]|jgi:hypothetical protein|nr:hypothetical protein [Gemmatimonadaceae bacterium]